AIELLCAAQALDLFTNLKPGLGTLKAYQVIRKTIAPLEKDRILSNDIEAMKDLIRSGKILAAVQKNVGLLN
ncbi:MAG: histidine ammonia-lyase, partial [Desulfobacterales bacterium]|nr:histidine ammonia-lyase [Desulfobacterales bacterium]